MSEEKEVLLFTFDFVPVVAIRPPNVPDDQWGKWMKKLHRHMGWKEEDDDE